MKVKYCIIQGRRQDFGSNKIFIKELHNKISIKFNFQLNFLKYINKKTFEFLNKF
jgi:hypothetical protein